MRALSAVVASALLLVGLSACGVPERVTYTYIKQNMTQQALLDDESRLKKVDGVHQVMGRIDDRNTVRIDVILDTPEKEHGLRYLLDQGYSQVRN